LGSIYRFLERVELLRIQRLLEASISNDMWSTMECIADPFMVGVEIADE
jgi:hypothetical protein